MMKLTKTKLLASLILAILFTITCGDSGTAPDPVKAPTINAEEQYAFTYNSQVSQMFPNSGGAIESYKLISGTLPTGLELAVTGGQLFLSGTPTKVTLNTAKTLITAVPLEIEATNKSGSSRATLNVTINPILVSGDKSMGVVHDVAGPDAAHTHNGMSHTHVGNSNNTPSGNPLIHTADEISFASGGTGSSDDPILIGVASDATSLSFVVDFDGVTIPNFHITNNNTFSIQLLGIPAKATITEVTLERMKALNLNNQMHLSFEPYITKMFPTSFFKGQNIGSIQTVTPDTQVLTNTLVFGNRQQKVGVASVSILESRVRFTIEITPPA